MKNTMIKFNFKNILLLLLFYVLQLNADFLFNQNFPSGGYLIGSYDKQAISPTPYNTKNQFILRIINI